jgi:hypothetical protein
MWNEVLAAVHGMGMGGMEREKRQWSSGSKAFCVRRHMAGQA